MTHARFQESVEYQPCMDTTANGVDVTREYHEVCNLASSTQPLCRRPSPPKCMGFVQVYPDS
jgi:hypothetical protein